MAPLSDDPYISDLGATTTLSTSSASASGSSSFRPASSCTICGCGRMIGLGIWHPGCGAGSAMQGGRC